METVRSVGRGLLGFKEERRGSRREEEERRGSKRSLEEERGKEALEEPVGHRMKRARRSPEVEVEGQGPSLASIPSMVLGGISGIWSWGVSKLFPGQPRLPFLGAETIQAAPPTRLPAPQDTDEVQLIKVVNPRAPPAQPEELVDEVTYDPPTLGLGLGLQEGAGGPLGGLAATRSTPAGGSPPGRSPLPRIRTGHEVSRRQAHLEHPNLARRLKAGQVSAASPRKEQRSVLSRLFGEAKVKRSQLATTFQEGLVAKERYRALLQRIGSRSARVGAPPPLSSTLRSPLLTNRTSIFPATKTDLSRAPGPLVAPPLTSTVVKSSSSLPTNPEASPVFARKEGKVEAKVVERKEVGGQEDVCSPAYLASMRERYDAAARERQRQIHREQVKADFHHQQNSAATELVEERLREYLNITQVAYDPEVEADLGPVELSPITPEMEEVIRRALASRGNVLVEAYNIPITVRDLNTLQGLNWLNDEVINFYLQMIVKRSEGEGQPKVWAFSTFFYPKLVDGSHATVKRWTKKVDLFSCSLVLVPVHLGMHWCLAVIDVEHKAIQYYDSMGGNNNRCLKALSSYLAEEHRVKKGSELDLSSWRMEIKKDIPQQMNGSDCGMFACKFSEYLSRRARISFTQADMPTFRRRMVYEIVKNDLKHP